MNKFIGLCSNARDWPPVMRKMGYRIQLIEQRISTESGSATPDIVAMSNKLSHAVVVDCKGGNSIGQDQDKGYRDIAPRHLLRWLDVKEPSRFKCSPCYAADNVDYGKLSPHTELPFIVFGSRSVEGKRDFGHADLNRGLCRRTSLANSREPTLFYPFSTNDDDDLILRYAVTGLLIWLNKNRPQSFADVTDDRTVADIVKIVHPQYKRMGAKHRNDLRKKVKKILGGLLDRVEFKEIRKKRRQGPLSAPVLQKFKDICRDIIDKRRVQTTLD